MIARGGIAEYLSSPGGKTAVITDENVDKYYGNAVTSALRGTAAKLVLPAGEATKSFETLQTVYEFLFDFQITRSDLIIALGGGVIGDLTGFAAATALRGVPYVQIPTSLLAQTDSSVGGKTAVNTARGKNLVGAFYQPRAALIDTDCLKTLDDRTFADGMAEVIKYGCIRDEKLFDDLARGEIAEHMDDIVTRCCDVKRAVVEGDEFDTGERMILNFGHTLGHAVENYYNYQKYTHGEAVAVGMYNISLAGERIGVTPRGTAEKIKRVLTKYRLPYALDVDAAALRGAMALDKKSTGGGVNIILLDRIGHAVIRNMPKNEVFQ
jgi:3-dehydroquinate synthase